MAAGESVSSWQINCPVPQEDCQDRILLAHGEGARLTRRLIQDIILPPLVSGERPTMADAYACRDAAVLQSQSTRLAVATDSHTVSPLFFPGGDLGTLAVFGTVNDLAVAGAQPRWLTVSLIMEEGLPIRVLEHVLRSAGQAAQECGVRIVAGDTKVLPRGTMDGLFINTTGIGELVDPVPPGPTAVHPGDRILVSGPLGQHGVAVLCARHRLHLEPPPRSDLRSLLPAVGGLREAAGEQLRAVRDATRGGVAAVLQEWAAEAAVTLSVQHRQVPVTDTVRGACELLGLDPLHVANEGTLVAIVAESRAAAALAALQALPGGELARMIGEAVPRTVSPVVVSRTLGAPQPLDEPSGSPLPRIC